MKKALVPAVAVLLILIGNSCKKCYRCYNQCTQCALTVNNYTFRETFCRDSFNTEEQYHAAISADTADGYVCVEIAPTYDRDFCSNQAGKDQYPTYYNKGERVTCDEK